MSVNADPPPGPEAWQAQNLRLIAFPRSPQFATQQNWWMHLTGAEPENVLDRRQRHEREESGTFQGASLSLAIDLLRIQWTVAPRVDAENINLEDQPPVLGPFSERQGWFRGLMEQWLPHCPPINRLAFTASLLHPVDDHPSGYQLLDRYLRWVEIDPQSSEFLYRINRRMPTATGIQGLVINRLSTWAVGKFTVLAQAIMGVDQPQADQQLLRGERFACVVELDVNTIPDFAGPLPQQDLPRIFAELVDAGVQLATHGDARP